MSVQEQVESGYKAFFNQNYKEALHFFTAALREEKSAKNHALCGMVFKRMQNWKQALSHYDRALKITPEDGDLYFHRAYISSRLADDEGVLEDCGKAEEAGCASVELFLLWARSLSRLSYWDEAEKLYSRVEKSGYRKPALYGRLGDIHARLGREQEALNDYARALELRFNDPEILYRYALLLYRSSSAGGSRKSEIASGDPGSFLFSASLLRSAFHWMFAEGGRKELPQFSAEASRKQRRKQGLFYSFRRFRNLDDFLDLRRNALSCSPFEESPLSQSSGEALPDSASNPLSAALSAKTYFCSFSLQKNNPLFWEKTGADQAGIALGFRWTRNFLRENELYPLKVRYGKEEKTHDRDRLKDFFQNRWGRAHKNYDAEKAYRLIGRRKEIFYAPSALKEVIFGSSCPLRYRNLILQFFKNSGKRRRHLKFYGLTGREEDSGELKIERIS